MNHYEEKKQRKIDRFNELAEKNKAKSEALYKSSKQISDFIPMGQPILVGHHSEGRHRRDLNRIDSKMRQSIEADNKAAYYEQRAASTASNRAISSDDPEAVTKLKEKIEKCRKNQEVMKTANKLVKKMIKGGAPWKDEELGELNRITGTNVAFKLLEPDFCGRFGFASYMLTNNNANISRMKKRLKELEAKSEAETKSYMVGDVEIVENVEENRLQIIFPSKPDEAMRTKLKGYSFRWSPYNKAWQRHLSEQAKHLIVVIFGTNQ